MKEILLTDNIHLALVDNKNYEWLMNYKWYWFHSSSWDASKGYACSTTNQILMHRLIMEPIPDWRIVDHINLNGLDNQEVNLRIITPSLNNHNKKVPAKGYYWDSNKNKWCAKIYVEGSEIYLGRFKTEIEAKQAYLSARDRIFGEKNVS